MTCCSCNAEITDRSLYCNFCGSKQSKPSKNKKSRGNGEGTVYKLPSGKWKAEVTICHKIIDGELIRKRRSKSTFVTKKDAINYLPYLKINDKPRIVKYTLFEIYKLWLNTQKYEKLSKSKITHYKTAWNRLIDLWYYDISNIYIEDMQNCIDNLHTGYYPKRDIKVLLSHLLNLAVRNEYIEKNRAKWLELPELKKSKKDAFNSEERTKLWDDYNSGNKFTGYALIMIYTGLRPGELNKVQYEKIFIEQKYLIGGIKSEAGIDRVVPLADEIIPIISELMNENGLIDIKSDIFYDEWAQIIKRTGIRPLNPHCCRHTCATMLAEQGIQPAIISEILGHANYSTTLGYTHISVNTKLEAINQIVNTN